MLNRLPRQSPVRVPNSGTTRLIFWHGENDFRSLSTHLRYQFEGNEVRSPPTHATEWQTGIRVEMVQPGCFAWVLVAPDGEGVVDLAESAEMYESATAALAAAESVLKLPGLPQS